MSERSDTGTSVLRWAWEWTKILATALVLFLVVRAFLVEAFQIPTGSMKGTLLPGDFLLVNKAVYGAEIPGTGWHLPELDEPEVGDVVVFRPPPSAGQPAEARYVKRVVGAPGDTLEMRDGALWRNGRPVEESYARHDGAWEDRPSVRFDWQERYLVDAARRRAYRPTRDEWGPLAVPPDSFFVMGDNRDDSEDSRYWGFVPREAITGSPLFIYFSYDRDGRASRSWLLEVRWDRLFETVR